MVLDLTRSKELHFDRITRITVPPAAPAPPRPRARLPLRVRLDEQRAPGISHREQPHGPHHRLCRLPLQLRPRPRARLPLRMRRPQQRRLPRPLRGRHLRGIKL